METKRRIALRHIDSGLFLSWSVDSMPHTRKESQARRFYSTEELAVFMEHSPYKPDEPDKYELITLKVTYEVEIEDAENVEGSKQNEVRSSSGET